MNAPRLKPIPGLADLVLAVLVSLAAAALALVSAPPLLRLPLGVPAVLLAPGYCLAVALFPDRSSLSRVERLALAAGASLAIVALLSILLNYLPWGLQPDAIIGALAGWTLLAAGAAAWRRRARAQAEDPATAAPPARLRLPAAPPLLTVPLVFALLLVGAALVLTLQAPDPELTEFYVLGPTGLADSYPSSIRRGEPVTLTVGIRNREGGPARYTVVVSAPAGATVSKLPPVELADGASWREPFTVALGQSVADGELRLSLYKDGGERPYRQLRLLIDATGATPGELSAEPAAPGPRTAGGASTLGRDGRR